MALKLVILGAGGLVGARLVTKLVDLQEFHVSPTQKLPLKEIVLFDISDKGIPQRSKSDIRFVVHLGDLTDKATVLKAFNPTGFTHITVIHLAALLSGNSEENFDLGMKINLFGTINVMEALREVGARLGSPQTYLYTSTDYVAAYNEYNRTHPVSEESFRLSPVSYGCQKACCEILVCDYTRKGFIDGRVGRLSAVIGRPGFSNSISYPYTGIFTQPLEGKDYDVPLPMEVPYPCSSLVNNCDGLLFLAGAVDGTKLEHNRVVQLPAKSYTLSQIWAAAQKVAAEEGITPGKINCVAPTSGATTVKEINVCPVVDCSKAQALGLPTHVDLHDIISDYVHVHIKKDRPDCV